MTEIQNSKLISRLPRLKISGMQVIGNGSMPRTSCNLHAHYPSNILSALAKT